MLGIKNKKGQLGFEESIYTIAFIFGFALFVVILYYTWTQMSSPLETAINSALPENSSFNVTNMNNNISTGTTFFNVIFPVILMGMIIFVLISAFFSQSHPMFFFISFILLGVVILLGVIFSNVYQELVYGTELSTVSSNFNIIEIFLKNLPLISVIIVTVLIVVLFSFSGKSGGATRGL